jgi:transposase-like protein
MNITQKIKKIIAAKDIIAHLDENNGIIECPACKSELSYSVAKNGHIWGKCKTKNCLSWLDG